jgi:hypothetical protein
LREKLACMVSHKCSCENHRLVGLIRAVLAPHGIRLLVDALTAGAAFTTGMQTFQFDAFLLLFTDEAWASEPCQLEIQSARDRRVPMFTAYVSGTLPEVLRTRIVWRPRFSDPQEFQQDAEILAGDMRTRVVLTRQLHLLTPENPPDVTREAAKRLVDAAASNVVAEFAQELTVAFRTVNDEITQFWIAQALGKADTPEAGKLLRSLPKPAHPYVSEGIRQALLKIEGSGCEELGKEPNHDEALD